MNSPAAGYTFSHYTVDGERNDSGSFTLNKDVTVSGVFTPGAPENLESITVTANPGKTTYFAGDDLDLSGLTVEAVYSGGSSVSLDVQTLITSGDLVVSGYDKNKSGEQTLTLSWQSKSTSFTVTVYDEAGLTLTGIEVLTKETKTRYVPGEDFSPASVTVEAVYEAGGLTLRRPVPPEELNIDSGAFNGGLEGTYTITVSWGGESAVFNVTVSVITLKERLDAVEGTGTIILSGSEPLEPYIIEGKTITLKGAGAERIIALNGNGSLFTVSADSALILDENITLQGRAENTGSLLTVAGTLTMKAGVKITGNTATSNYGGGVYLTGTFGMEGGEISGNTARYNGGGVYVAGTGSFTLKGGEISGNTGSGGGVFTNGSFTMTGGKITGNRGEYHYTEGDYQGVTGRGGGVHNRSGSFVMEGGEISENTAHSAGGGVYNEGSFTLKGGKASPKNNNYTQFWNYAIIDT
jgi:parallel beta-helix repeat protein